MEIRFEKSRQLEEYRQPQKLPSGELDLDRFLSDSRKSAPETAFDPKIWKLSESGGSGSESDEVDTKGSAPANGVAASGGDFLASQPFRYASFFARLRERLRENWNWRASRLRAPASSNQTYVTTIEVRLDAAGQVLDYELKGPSGWIAADEAAREAVSRLDTLQALPQGLFEQLQGRLVLRFHLKAEREGFSWSKVEDPRFRQF